MMNKCRICLESKRNLCSIFENNQGLSYASMIALITGIKITKDEKELICLLCRRKLTDFYEFKVLIERSDLELSKHSKLLRFNTIDDIKDEFKSQVNSIQLGNVAIDYNLLFQNGKECTLYNNTLIRRLIREEKESVPIADFLSTIKSEEFEENCHTSYLSEFVVGFFSDQGTFGTIALVLTPNPPNTLIRRLIREEKESVPIADFLSTIKSEEFEENCHVDDYEQDHTESMHKEYNYYKRKKKKTWKMPKKNKATKRPLEDANKICIKPVVLKDIRVLKVKTKKRKSNCKPASKETLCPFCGKICTKIRSHILKHTGEKKFKCHDCAKSFSSKAYLQHHIIKLHSAIKKNYECEHCIGTFSSKTSVLRHMALHMNQQFSCIVCKKNFKWKASLKRHMKIHSMAPRSIQCDECSMSFHTNGALKAHYRVHTGERPYKCELCSQPYSYKRDFNRHCLKKHGIVIDRRPVYVMNDEVLKSEKALMKDLMLHLHGIPTESEPMDSFRGPQKAQAFAKALKVMQNGQIQIDVQL